MTHEYLSMSKYMNRYSFKDFKGPLCTFMEKAMATHSSTLAWKIPRAEEPGRLQSMGSDFTFTFPFRALEKEMATHSNALAWRIPGTGEPVGLPFLGSHRVGHDWSNLAAAACTFMKLSLSPHSFLCTDTVLKFKLPQPLSFYLLKSMSVMWYA